MRILQLCLRFPFPTCDGGTMAMASLANGLIANEIDLHIFALNTSKHLATEGAIAAAQEHYNIKAFYIDNHIGFGNTLANLCSRKAFHVSRFHHEHIEKELIKLLLETAFDAVVFESIFMTPYLAAVQSNSKAITVLRSHNIEYKIWEGVLIETKNLVKKAYLRLQMKRLKRYEIQSSGLFDIVAAITSVDCQFYKALATKAEVIYVPFGIDIKKVEHNKKVQTQFTIGFLGSMDWMPNQEGIRWFLAEIWPLVQRVNPNILCKIAGRHTPLDLFQCKQANVQILGEIQDAEAFLHSLDLVVVPLRSGSGVRIKVLESMALAVPVLATKVGYEGIDAQPGIDIFEANGTIEFADAILYIASNPTMAYSIAHNAQRLIKERYAVDTAANILIKAIATKANFK